jgi:alpha-beta hydrolase superfamily lysophospholipase
MPFFTHRGAQIHYVEVGDHNPSSRSIPLVFIHGAGSSHISWALQLREFSPTNRMIALDLSGHGKSDDVDGDASINATFSLEVAALIEHLNLTNFILIGHSMGGGVAMSYCLNISLPPPTALKILLIHTKSRNLRIVFEEQILAFFNVILQPVVDSILSIRSRIFRCPLLLL